jgi:hypothetical protein
MGDNLEHKKRHGAPLQHRHAKANARIINHSLGIIPPKVDPDNDGDNDANDPGDVVGV